MTSRADAVAILERRLQLLEQRIYERESAGRGSSYDRAEAGAIRLALRELSHKDAQTT